MSSTDATARRMQQTVLDPNAVPVDRPLLSTPFITFYIAACAISWIPWALVALSPEWLDVIPQVAPTIVLIAAGTFGPTIAAFAVAGWWDGREGVRDLLIRFTRWRVGLRWYLFVLFGFPMLLVLGAVLVPGVAATFSGPQVIGGALVSYLAALIPVTILAGPLGEEAGWDGYALPRLQRRLGPVPAGLVLGLLWAFWHAPLLIIPSVAGDRLGVVGTLGFVLAITFNALITVWTFNHTQGSLLIAMLLHGANNAFSAQALFDSDRAGTDLPAIVGLGLFAMLLIVLTRGRMGLPTIAPGEGSAAHVVQ